MDGMDPMDGLPYWWAWPKRPTDRNRKGMRLRVICRSASMNSALVEFEDGVRHVVSRNGLRKMKVG